MARSNQQSRYLRPTWWQTVAGILLGLASVGCQPLPGTVSPGMGSRLGMGPQNRAIGNSAFNSVAYGESAYGRVAYGPGVSIPGLVSPNGTTTSGGTTVQWDLQGQNQPNTSGLATSPAGPVDQAYTEQLQRLNADNNELYRQLASLQQQLRTTQETNQSLQQQLTTTTGQLDQLQRLNQDAQQRLQVMQASNPNSGGFQGATLRGNNSLTQHADRLRVPGTTVLTEGDVIRVVIPSDFVFQPGRYEFQPAAQSVLNQLASAIRQYYPGQIVGIEAHADNAPQGGSSVGQHQVTSSQALAVMNHLTSSQLLPSQQLLVMGYGGNRPRFSNATAEGQAANRRIEFVIYPDSF